MSLAGGSTPHNNMMPSLGIHFIICVDYGVWPSPF
jgi:microcystin-dependent protein